MMPPAADAESSTAKKRSNEVEKRSESNNCHQCRKNDRGRVVKCSNCHTKQYCIRCITKWYPRMEESAFVEACPCCCNNCNCKACLRKDLPIPDLNLSAEDRILYSKHIVKVLLPSLKQFLVEEKLEKDEEAKHRGLSVTAVRLTTQNIDHSDGVQCNKCKTSIFDIHRSCLKCSYKLCVACCQEIREHEDGRYLLHSVKLTGILCPPANVGGCGQGNMDLTSIYPEKLVSEILTRAEAVDTDTLEMSERACACSRSYDGSEAETAKLRKAASREGSNDNYLYCATALGIEGSDLKHFQWHLYKGEPVIVSNVLSGTSELSWEPMVMRRACRESAKTNPLHIKDFSVLNCLTWCQESINIHLFFKGYVEGIFDNQEQLKMLKLEDWPPSESFKERLPRHNSEFIRRIPFKEYSLCPGYLNITCKKPEMSTRLDTGPKLYVGYGVDQELGYGSVTRLHYAISDRVNVLMHTAGIALKPTYHQRAKKLRRTHVAQDGVERLQGSEDPEGGAVWDIFRRQDIPMLEEYLRNHSSEFVDVFPAPQMVHPIHDQAFYLTVKHKRKLKEEYGIEPWTFVQRLGDAVFIPAGCPHQIRNLKSCTSVAVNFVSPESVRECIRLSEEYRHLPSDHRCKEDKLQVKKLVFRAVREAVEYLDKIIPLSSRNTIQQPFKPMEEHMDQPLKPMESDPSSPLEPMEPRTSEPVQPIEAPTGPSLEPMDVPTDPSLEPMEAPTDPSLEPMEGRSNPLPEPTAAHQGQAFKPMEEPTKSVPGPSEAGPSQSSNPMGAQTNRATQGAKPSIEFMWQNLVQMKMILLKEGHTLTPEVRANLGEEIEGLLRKIASMGVSVPSSSRQPK